MANNNPAHIVLTDVRLSYTHLYEPYASQPGQEPKYSATVLVPKSSNQRGKIDAAIAAATQKAQEKYGKAFPPQPKVSVHDGDGTRPSDGQPFGDECKGCWVFTASSKERPKVVDLQLQPILDSTEIYSGMYANVGVTFFGYNAPQNKGVGVGLENIQKIRDGEPLGGGRAAIEDDFAAVASPAAGYAPQYTQPSPPQYSTPAPSFPQYQPIPDYPQQPQYSQPGYYDASGYPTYPQQQ